MNTKKFLILFLIIGLFVVACSENPKSSTADSQEKQEVANELTVNKTLFQNCQSCHPRNNGNVNQIAPSFTEIDSVYRSKYTSSQDYVNAMSTFINNPVPESSANKEWLATYNIMPQMNYNKEEITKIANYLYYNGVEALYSYKDSDIQEKTLSNLEKGKSLALQTKAVLGSNLMKAIKEYGTDGAVDFCNIKAISITDNMSKELKAKISRVTNNPRNPNNLASAEESKILDMFIKDSTKRSYTIENQNTVVGYYAIETNAMCLKCHGKPEQDINAKTLAIIKEKYPKDQAIGYAPNQLRGMWKVEMSK